MAKSWGASFRSFNLKLDLSIGVLGKVIKLPNQCMLNYFLVLNRRKCNFKSIFSTIKVTATIWLRSLKIQNFVPIFGRCEQIIEVLICLKYFRGALIFIWQRNHKVAWTVFKSFAIRDAIRHVFVAGALIINRSSFIWT